MKVISINQVPEGSLMFNWLEDGILCGRIASNISIDLQTAVETSNMLGKFAGRKSFPILLEGCDIRSIKREAREYFATPAANANVLATAIVAGSFLDKLTGNIFLAFNKPFIATRVFTDRAAAKQWLQKVCEMQFEKAAIREIEHGVPEHVFYA